MENMSSSTGCSVPTRTTVWNTARRHRLAEAIVAWCRKNGGMTDSSGIPHYMMNIGHVALRPFYMRYITEKTHEYTEEQGRPRRDGDIGQGPVTPGDVDRIEFELGLLRADVLAEMERLFVKEAIGGIGPD